MVHGQLRNLGVARWRLLVSLLCVALLVLAGTLAVAHGHEPGNISHNDCGLCATAHVTVQVVAALLMGPSQPVVTRFETFVPEARPRTLSRFALFTRPPPANPHLNS